MRVINKVNRYRVACTKCKSLLEFEFADVYYRSKEPYIGYIKCPVCGCAIGVLSGRGESFFLGDDVVPEICCEE